MVNTGQIAEAKGKVLPLCICYKPLLGFFIGTKVITNHNEVIFTKESIEVFDSLIEINKVFKDGSWSQALDCNIFYSD